MGLLGEFLSTDFVPLGGGALALSGCLFSLAHGFSQEVNLFEPDLDFLFFDIGQLPSYTARDSPIISFLTVFHDSKECESEDVINLRPGCQTVMFWPRDKFVFLATPQARKGQFQVQLGW